MSRKLRVEHVVADRRSVGEAAEFYRSVRGHSNEDRFRWLYLDNPAGRAHLFFLRTTDGDLRGMSNAIPAKIQVGHRTHVAWNTVDFALDPHCRTLGPALKLRRALFDAAGELGVAMVYYYPAAQFRPLHERAGADGIWPNVQLRFPVHWRELARRVADRTGVMQPVAQTVLACTSWLCEPPVQQSRYAASPRAWNELQPVLPLLAERAAARRTTFGCSWQWLAWRFRDCPVYRCEPFVVVEGNRPAALAVVATVGQAAWLKLLWPPAPHTAALDALGTAVRQAGSLAQDGLLRAVVVENHWLQRLCAGRRVLCSYDDSISVVRRTNTAAGQLPEPPEWDRLISDRDL